MATIKGKWVFNNEVSLAAGGTALSQSVSFTSNGANYSLVNLTHLDGFGTPLLYYGNTLVFDLMGREQGFEGWRDEVYRYVDFGETEQDVSDAFHTYMDTNATPEAEPIPTDVVTVEYNGSVIASLNAGQSATVECEGLLMEGDIVVVAPEASGDTVAEWDYSYSSIPVVEEVTDCIAFSSSSAFVLRTNNATKNWDGTLEYSVDKKVWNVWDGITRLSADCGRLYLRGINNTLITGGFNKNWCLFGTADITCNGNIENLLDHTIVATGGHPKMAKNCYYGMFKDCLTLAKAPELSATTLAETCYYDMFRGCTNLKVAPELPATTLTTNCYYGMFYGCTNLKIAPELPATNLADYCYDRMFMNSGLVTAPELSATTLASRCYQYMFYGCVDLKTAPELPATTLKDWCYYRMFYGCTSLTTAPELPANKVSFRSYEDMFRLCTALTRPPVLHATQLSNYSYAGMFNGCTALAAIPALPATILAAGCYDNMFKECLNIKLSTAQTSEYSTPYRIPTYCTATGGDEFVDMFLNTGGTFKGAPSVNTTYYTSNEVMALGLPIFTIEESGYAEAYYFKEGMTWMEWCQSEYNTSGSYGYTCSSEQDYVESSSYRVNDGDTSVIGSDVIKPGTSYTKYYQSPSGGGSN